jgi:single-stranded-DNA-specific exonuclease
MEKWLEIRKGAPFQEISRKFGIDPVIARIIRNREIIGDEAIEAYLHADLTDLEDPLALDGLKEAAFLLRERIREGKRIRVIGDYDIDGVCATYILEHILQIYGAQADHAIPDRIRDGYGLNLHLIERALEDGIDTIITCDNGIAALEQIRYAKDHGMTVIVTDHHEPLYEEDEKGRQYLLPDADVVIDPKSPGCSYPNKNLCGAGVAWKLMHFFESLLLQTDNEGYQAAKDGVKERERDLISFREKAVPAILPLSRCPETMEMLPFAGFATVGDVMDLTGENRILVRYALRMLPHTRNAGMRALISACGLSGEVLSAYHIGFILGPCINASGRLETAELSLRLFLTEDIQDAGAIASRLRVLNDERKDMTQKGTDLALEEALGGPLKEDRVLIIYLPGIHESVAGIIAGKVREAAARPVFVLTDTMEEGLLKGSGRSIEEYPMFDSLLACSDLLVKFGGHPMAAGLTIERERLEEFRKRMNSACTLTQEDLTRKVRIDARMPLGYISERLISQLDLLEPCGKGNEKPLFAAVSLRPLSARLIGRGKNMLRLKVRDRDGTVMDALYFRDAQEMLDSLAARYGEAACQKLLAGRGEGMTMSVTYYPQINEFRGVSSLQIVIQNYIC